jgi:hypothetical protein
MAQATLSVVVKIISNPKEHGLEPEMPATLDDFN